MLMHSKTARQRGETLIELLLAFAILSLALVTVMRTMNGGLDSMFVNGQRSQVEAQMRGQLAVLQAAHQQAVKDPSAADWAEITSKIATSAASREQDVTADGCTYTANKNRLSFPTSDASSWTSEVDTKSGGAMSPVFETPAPDGTSMWIEAKHKPKDETAMTRGYYDFYIKSCWQGGGGVVQEAKMVTRLYDVEATTATPLYNNLILTANDDNCSSGSNGRITYRIRNNNTYPFGDVRITITGGFNRVHSNVGPGADIIASTPSNYAAGNYMVRATIVSSPGDFVEVPVTVLLCPPPPINIAGSSHTGCAPLFDREFDERIVGRPGYGFMSNPGPYMYPCQTFPAFGTTYACVNYDARYAPSITRSGSYRLTLTYFDANCGDASNETMNVSGYNYRVEVYVNGVHDGSMSLAPGAPMLTSAYNFSQQLNPGDTIGLRWWNNRFIDPGSRDPDFVIRNILLEWR